jgi:hypothetical protein
MPATVLLRSGVPREPGSQFAQPRALHCPAGARPALSTGGGALPCCSTTARQHDSAAVGRERRLEGNSRDRDGDVSHIASRAREAWLLQQPIESTSPWRLLSLKEWLSSHSGVEGRGSQRGLELPHLLAVSAAPPRIDLAGGVVKVSPGGVGADAMSSISRHTVSFVRRATPGAPPEKVRARGRRCEATWRDCHRQPAVSMRHSPSRRPRCPMPSPTSAKPAPARP